MKKQKWGRLWTANICLFVDAEKRQCKVLKKAPVHLTKCRARFNAWVKMNVWSTVPWSVCEMCHSICQSAATSPSTKRTIIKGKNQRETTANVISAKLHFIWHESVCFTRRQTRYFIRTPKLLPFPLITHSSRPTDNGADLLQCPSLPESILQGTAGMINSSDAYILKLNSR